MDKVKHKRVILINGKTPRQVAGNNRNCLASREIDLREAIDQLPDPDRVRRLLAVRWVRRTLAFLASTDPRSVAACDTAERFANGHASRTDVLFEEEEPTTQRRDLLMDLLSHISELEAEADEILKTLQRDGMNPTSKAKTSSGLLRINRIVHELEETLGVYREVPRPTPRVPSKPGP